MINFINDFRNSKNKIYFLLEHKGTIVIAMALLTSIFGTYGYYINNIDTNYSYYQRLIASILSAFALFGLNFPSIDELNFATLLSSLAAVCTVSFTIILIFFKKQINNRLFYTLSNKEHMAVFGLGHISRTFLDNLKSNRSIIIIDQADTYAEEYRAKGFGVHIGDAFNEAFLYKNLNFDTMRYVLIAFGDDKANIEFTKILIDIYRKKSIKTKIKLIIHINNKNISTLFHKNFMLKNTKNTNIDIKTFSYYEECARDLFEKYWLDGDSMEYIESDKPFRTVLAGEGELIRRVVYKIIALSHFPNRNIHKIHIVHKDANSLLEKIKLYTNYTNSKFPSIELIANEIDYEKPDFYEESIWHEENLENIIVCYENETTNIKLGNTLQEKIYLSSCIECRYRVPKIIMAVFNQLRLSGAINVDKEEYKNLFTFGSKKDIINEENLLNEAIDHIAKIIHSGYGDEFDPNKLIDNQKDIDKKWYETARYSDKLSNIAQARHIDVKLKSLGLAKVKSKTRDKKALLEKNKKLLDERLGDRIGDKKITKASKELEKLYNGKKTTVMYWPNGRFDNNIFEKLIRVEHERWNTHHYLEGWKYSEKKNKDKKEHDCLIPVEKFKTVDMKMTILYDIYSFMYLPNYLSEAGYEIVSH